MERSFNDRISRFLLKLNVGLLSTFGNICHGWDSRAQPQKKKTDT